MMIGLTVQPAICRPDFVSALANAVFQALIHLKRPDLADDDPSSSPSMVNDGLILAAGSRRW